MSFLVICFLIVALMLILASTFLTASSFLQLIGKIIGYSSRKKALKIWTILVTLYLLSEILVGYELELLFKHLAVGSNITVLFLDTIDVILALYGIASALTQTVPILPLIGTDKISALSLSFGLFGFSVLGLFYIYSWLPGISGLILRSTEICGFIVAFLFLRFMT